MKRSFIINCLAVVIILAGCQDDNNPKKTTAATFGADVDFLQQHLKDVVILHRDNDSSRVLVTGDYQARVMTSTTGGRSGKSYGWINYKLIASGKYDPHINAFGGEERIWLGPEGGQYALFFPAGAAFDYKNWQTPGLLDTAHFEQVSKTNDNVTYNKKAALTNYAGTNFDVDITRSITLLDEATFVKQSGITLPPGVKVVTYQTENKLVNNGATAWNENTGLLSIWLLGMFQPSDQTVIAAPFKPLADARQYITDDYFGKISPDYLQVKDSVLLLKADGKSRGKIGLSPKVAKPIAGSVDVERGSITLICFTIEEDGRYVNSKWEQQKEPYKGDVVNCYNDGPLADGSQMGPFYEVESSSAVRALLPGDAVVYRQITAHIEGDKDTMDKLAQSIWHMSLKQIAASFPVK